MTINESFSFRQIEALWRWRNVVVGKERGWNERVAVYCLKKAGAMGATELGYPFLMTAALVEGAVSLVFSALCLVLGFWSPSGRGAALGLGLRGISSLGVVLGGAVHLLLNLVPVDYFGDVRRGRVVEAPIETRVKRSTGPIPQEPATEWNESTLGRVRAHLRGRVELARRWDSQGEFIKLEKRGQPRGDTALKAAIFIADLICGFPREQLRDFIENESECLEQILKSIAVSAIKGKCECVQYLSAEGQEAIQKATTVYLGDKSALNQYSGCLQTPELERKFFNLSIYPLVRHILLEECCQVDLYED